MFLFALRNFRILTDVKYCYNSLQLWIHNNVEEYPTAYWFNTVHIITIYKPVKCVCGCACGCVCALRTFDVCNQVRKPNRMVTVC